MKDHQVVLYDGICNFCNFWVNFIIAKDKSDKFRFAALQSETGKKFLNQFNLSKTDFDTFILIDKNKFSTKSTAALIICKNLSGFYKLLYIFIIIPRFFRDIIYNLVAKNRYKLFGKRDVCKVPTEREKNKFL